MHLAYKHVPSPVGTLKLVASQAGLVAVLWDGDTPERVPLAGLTVDEDHPTLVGAQEQLEEYFAGARKTFELPLDPRGTPFQRQVWESLLTIPYGETRSYGDLANGLGMRNGSRAVGAANGRNPLSIVVPCHRVVGSTGRLTGFAGGLPAKAHLLELESLFG